MTGAAPMLLFATASLAVLVGCLVPNAWLPHPMPNDKLMHFAAFAVLTALAMRMADSPASLAAWTCGLMLAGLLIEVLQSWVPDRKFCWQDALANTAGIALVAVPTWLFTM